MTELTAFLDAYGYWLFLGLGFAEFAGLPIATIPLLVAAGGLAASGAGPAAWQVAALAGLGGWLADGLWYGVGRLRGARLVDLACGLSANPGACVFRVSARLEQVGVPYIAVSKFIPGAGNLVASAAGIVRFPARLFLATDAVAMGAWAGTWVLLGVWFGEPVQAVVRAALRYSAPLAAAVVALIVLGTLWRVVRVLQHRAMHRAARPDWVPNPNGKSGAVVAAGATTDPEPNSPTGAPFPTTTTGSSPASTTSPGTTTGSAAR